LECRLADARKARDRPAGRRLSGGSAAGTQESNNLDTAALDRALGHEGKTNGGVYQFTILRAETITDNGLPIPVSMGTGIAIDFVLIASEVNPMLRALRESGIEVAAVPQPHAG
jgi:hypothetical protein